MSGKKRPTTLATLLPRVLQEKKLSERLGLHQVFLFWNEVVGRDIARRAQPRCIRGTVLWVGVSDSVWMQHLQLERLALLERINPRLPSATKLTDIRFQLEPGVRKASTPSVAAAKRRPAPVSEEKVRAFEELISSVQDQEAQAVLRRLWRKQQQRR